MVREGLATDRRRGRNVLKRNPAAVRAQRGLYSPSSSASPPQSALAARPGFFVGGASSHTGNAPATLVTTAQAAPHGAALAERVRLLRLILSRPSTTVSKYTVASVSIARSYTQSHSESIAW